MRPLSYRMLSSLPKLIYLGSDGARIQPQVFWLQNFALGPFPMDFNNIDETLWTTLKGGHRDDREVTSNSNKHCEDNIG